MSFNWYEKSNYYVYLVKSKFKGKPAFKVGYTWSLKYRLSAIKRTYGLKTIEIVKERLFQSRIDAFNFEQKLVEKLKPYQIKGEWFHQFPGFEGILNEMV